MTMSLDDEKARRTREEVERRQKLDGFRNAEWKTRVEQLFPERDAKLAAFDVDLARKRRQMEGGNEVAYRAAQGRAAPEARADMERRWANRTAGLDEIDARKRLAEEDRLNGRIDFFIEANKNRTEPPRWPYDRRPTLEKDGPGRKDKDDGRSR